MEPWDGTINPEFRRRHVAALAESDDEGPGEEEKKAGRGWAGPRHRPPPTSTKHNKKAPPLPPTLPTTTKVTTMTNLQRKSNDKKGKFNPASIHYSKTMHRLAVPCPFST